MADAEPAPSLATSLARLNTAMANLAIAQVSMDSNLHASHFRLEALQASMLSKLDLIILRLDTMISHQRSPFRSSVQLPPPLSPLFPPLAQPPLPPPAPPSNASSYHPSQYPHQPHFHVPPPMAGQRDSHAIGIDSSTIDFPVSVWQHHRADINRHFRTNPRWYHKIPYDNDIFLLGDVIVGHQIRSRWIWILFATETPFCSVRHRRQRPSPHCILYNLVEEESNGHCCTHQSFSLLSYAPPLLKSTLGRNYLHYKPLLNLSQLYYSTTYHFFSSRHSIAS